MDYPYLDAEPTDAQRRAHDSYMADLRDAVLPA